jgi:hypothetical protein
MLGAHHFSAKVLATVDFHGIPSATPQVVMSGEYSSVVCSAATQEPKQAEPDSSEAGAE